jgi:hypothetical protein
MRSPSSAASVVVVTDAFGRSFECEICDSWTVWDLKTRIRERFVSWPPSGQLLLLPRRRRDEEGRGGGAGLARMDDKSLLRDCGLSEREEIRLLLCAPRMGGASK